MVQSVTSLSPNGLRDWLIQRVTSVLIGLYTLFIFAFIICHPRVQFYDWHNLFAHSAMKIFSFLVILSITLHAWIGIWTVLTDYVKGVALRLVLEVAVVLSVFIYIAWGVQILWGFV